VGSFSLSSTRSSRRRGRDGHHRRQAVWNGDGTT
jgi:hypothetical protein